MATTSPPCWATYSVGSPGATAIAVAPWVAATFVRVTRAASRFAGAVLVVGAVVVGAVDVEVLRAGPSFPAADDESPPPEHAATVTASTHAPSRTAGRRRILRG